MDNIFHFIKIIRFYARLKKDCPINFFNKNEKKLLKEKGFSENDINRLNLEFKKFFIRTT